LYLKISVYFISLASWLVKFFRTLLTLANDQFVQISIIQHCIPKMYYFWLRKEQNRHCLKPSLYQLMNTQMLADKPISEQQQDRFQRYEFSKRIASIVASPKVDQSLVVGLYGKWGEGKTTVMNFIEQELPAETVRVKFNPWLFSDEQHLIKSFFSGMCEAIGAADKTLLEKFGNLLSDYGSGIGLLTQFAGIGGDGLKGLGDKLKNTSTQKMKQRIDDLIVDSGKNIVVFVDDIDRLDVNEVQYVFKLVKLVADFPRTCYVLSFDDEMVAAALAPKYGGERKIAGYNFLEKIIQIPLKIPKAGRAALSKFTLDLVNKVLDDTGVDLEKTQASYFLDIFNSAFLPYIDNPRLSVRYANTLSFSVPLLQGEANISDVMIVEGLKIFYPELYDFIRSNSNIFLTRSDSYRSYDRNENKKAEIRSELDNALSVYDVKRQKVVTSMLQELFPQLQHVYRNSSYTDEYYHMFAREKRICSGRYFDRYFSYTVQEGDIPDRYFDQFLAGLETKDVEAVACELRDIATQYSSFDLMLKLRLNAASLNEFQAQNLATALAGIGHELPAEEGTFFTSAFADSAIVIVALLKNIAAADRLEFAKWLLTACGELEYAMELYYWLTTDERYTEDSAVVKKEEQVILKELLVSLFMDRLDDDNFFTILRESSLWRLLKWWKSSDLRLTLDAFWHRNLVAKNDPDFAFKIIHTFTPTIVSTTLGVEGSRTFKANFQLSSYEDIKAVVEPGLLNENLTTKFGMHPYDGDPATLSQHEPISENTMVAIFQWFFMNDSDQSDNSAEQCTIQKISTQELPSTSKIS
jgi:predicted KAP-like P-loop ATPase